MMTSLFSLVLVSIPSFAAPELSPAQQELLKVLQSKAGSYELTQQSSERPCHAMLRELQPGSRIQFAVKVQESTDEYFKAGDIIATLEQEVDGRSYRLFDRAPFFAVNAGTRRSTVIRMGVLISHQSLYDSGNRLLTHTVTTTTPTGGEQALQSLQFGFKGGLVYDYTIYSRNALGITKETIPSDHCEFQRVGE